MNDSLYDQLIELTKIPDAYSKWSIYRDEITRLIKDECHGGSLLIVGAGECNDVDIHGLSEQFSSITLLDRSYDNNIVLDVKNAINNKVTYVSEDLLGISDSSYRMLCEACQDYIAFNINRFSISAFADRYMTLAENMYKEARPLRSMKKGQYDNVVCIGVHSQINNMLAWIWDAYEAALGQHDARVHNYIRKKNDTIIPEINDYLFSVADKKLIIGAEQSRVGMDGAVEGAHQCILDVQRRLQNYSYIDVNLSVMDWPFDLEQGKVYQMLVSSISL